jgi:hypothetical protein
VLLTDQPDMANGGNVRAPFVDLGPKLSTRTWRALARRWPLLLWRLRRELAAEAPYDALLVHHKKSSS